MAYEISEVTVELVAEILLRNPLKPFDGYDWECYCGCDSADPEIAYEENLSIIKDGATISVIDNNSEYADFVDFSVAEIQFTQQLIAG